MTPQEYLEQIKKKLDSMNKEAGIDPSQSKNQNRDRSMSPLDPIMPDPFTAMGLQALKYTEEQKKKNL